MNWDVVVCFYEIDIGEDFPESKLMCEVGNVPNWILDGDSPSIQNTIVTAGPPSVFFLCTRWRGEFHGLSESRVVPLRCISSNSDLAIRIFSSATR